MLEGSHSGKISYFQNVENSACLKLLILYTEKEDNRALNQEITLEEGLNFWHFILHLLCGKSVDEKTSAEEGFKQMIKGTQNVQA